MPSLADAQTVIQTQTHKHRHTDTDTHTDTQTHTHTDTDTQTQTHTDTQTHRHTHTHAHTHTHTHTHTEARTKAISRTRCCMPGLKNLDLPIFRQLAILMQPAITPGCARCITPEFLYNKGNHADL